MTKLSLEEVEAIANLARLALTDEEKASLQDQLSSILDYVEALQALETNDVSPTTSALSLHTIMRADEIKPALSVAEALANAPAVEDDQFQVKPIL